MIRSMNRVTVRDLSIIDDISMVNVRIYYEPFEAEACLNVI
jgi:hypothetical protein